jgi:hypothetical protein
LNGAGPSFYVQAIQVYGPAALSNDRFRISIQFSYNNNTDTKSFAETLGAGTQGNLNSSGGGAYTTTLSSIDCRYITMGGSQASEVVYTGGTYGCGSSSGTPSGVAVSRLSVNLSTNTPLSISMSLSGVSGGGGLAAADFMVLENWIVELLRGSIF